MIVPAEATRAGSDRTLCGWRVRSDLSLDELVPWTGDGRAPDIRIQLATIPAPRDEPVHEGPFLTVDRDGTCRFTVAGVASYFVQGGHSIIIEPLATSDRGAIRLFLFGTVLGILCHQRGLFPLHASAVRIGTAAHVFMGKSGAGKSTLAAALAARGHVLLADDVAVIDMANSGDPLLWPSLTRVKLWSDSVRALAVDPADLPRTRAEQAKYHLAFPSPTPLSSSGPAPVRLAAIYGLVQGDGSSISPIERAGGIQAAALVSSNIYRNAVGHWLGRRANLFTAMCRLAQNTAIHQLVRPDDLETLGALARQVEAHAAQFLP